MTAVHYQIPDTGEAAWEIADMISETFGRSTINADHELAKEILTYLASLPRTGPDAADDGCLDLTGDQFADWSTPIPGGRRLDIGSNDGTETARLHLTYQDLRALGACLYSAGNQ